MRAINKTRYALLGMLLEGPQSGYEIKAFMKRSTGYFWRESDSTIYPMLKLLEKEGKVSSKRAYVGKKKKMIYSISESGRKEFKAWLKGPTGAETQRNEFLLKLFFSTAQKEVNLIVQERLEKMEALQKEYQHIEVRLKVLKDSFKKTLRLKALQYGMESVRLELKWLKKEFLEKEI